MNSHRSGWDGRICTDAASWQCGAKTEFRVQQCDQGRPLCYHVELFADSGPQLVMHQSGVAWLLEKYPETLNDRILLLWGRSFHEPRGIDEANATTELLFGAYRVQSVERVERGTRVDWVAVPYEDGWTRFHELEAPAPRGDYLGGPYVKEVERADVLQSFELACERAQQSSELSPEDRDRLFAFAAQLPSWLDVPSPEDGDFVDDSRPARSPFVELQTTPRPRRIADETAPRPRPLEGNVASDVRSIYGADVTTSLLSALARPLVVFFGSAGTGKSTLASRLLDDPQHERTLVLPADPRWQTTADVLGSDLLDFLVEAEEAWEERDDRARAIVFDDVDPERDERWLAELVTRAEYPAHARRDRSLLVPSTARRTGRERVFIPPTVQLVATVTGRTEEPPIGPRLRDRVGLVRLAVAPRTALERAGVQLDEETVQAIEALENRLDGTAPHFSFRSAAAVRSALDAGADLGTTEAEAVDAVLRSDVLDRLSAEERRSNDALRAWADGHAELFPRCAEVLSS